MESIVAGGLQQILHGDSDMSFVLDDTSSVMHLVATNLASGYTLSTDSTIFLWFKKSATGKQAALGYAYSFGSIPADIHAVYAEQSGGDLIHGRAEPYGASGGDVATGNVYSANTWTPVISTVTLGGSVTIKMGGGSKVSGGPVASAWQFASFSRVMLGENPSSAYTQTGQTLRVAHVGCWKVALSDSDAASLLGGANPLAINAANLVEYWSGASLTGYNSTVLSWSGGTGTVNDSDNPTVDDPPGGASAVPLLMQMYHGG